MKKRMRVTVYTAVLCVVMAALCGCARREPAADGLDVLTLAEEGPAEGLAEGEIPSGQPGVSGGDNAGSDAAMPAGGASAGTDMTGVSEVSEPEVCYVYICGAVEKPGVYEMEAGDRVYAVIGKAGGFTQEACEDYVNQAVKVADGLRIWIPTVEEAKEAETGGSAAGADGGRGLEYPKEAADGQAAGQNASGLVNINTAGEEQLCTLTGIGKAKAQAIIAYRSEHGNFTRIEDIMNVAGIKESGFEKIRDQITVNQ